jgi:phosphatidylglycerol:prolipoprotein diacylglycerol transferase
LGHVIRLGDSFGITMGQLLSLPMLAAGVLLILYARRRMQTHPA